MQVADDVPLTPKMKEQQREPPASAAAGVGSFFWGLETCGSPEGLRHSSIPAEFIDVMDCDQVEGVRGCVKVTVTTTMSYRVRLRVSKGSSIFLLFVFFLRFFSEEGGRHYFVCITKTAVVFSR